MDIKARPRHPRHPGSMMWPYHPDLLATPVPRYTSYPTAAEFGAEVGAADMVAALNTVAAEAPISLYLHVPFCRAICWYCGCNTGAANRADRLAAYVGRLGEEIDLIAGHLAGRGRVVHVAWGGGSPNAMTTAQFDALNARLADAFGLNGATQSVEIDPRAFTPAWADALARHNVDRVSLGVQTFAPHIQQAIGRIQPTESIERAMTRLRAAGVGSVNFDGRYGLPGPTARDLVETLATAIAMAPERLAVFGYAHVPHLIARQRRIDASALPDATARFAMAAAAHDRLTTAGYAAVGFDHFALPGDALAVAARAGTLARNFQGFTADPARVLIGMGASAISAFPGALLQNEKNSGRWHLMVGAGRLPISRGLKRGPRDRAIAAAIESLLCHGAADVADLPGAAAARARMEPFLARGLASWTDGRLTLAPDAQAYARGIAACLDPWRSQSAARFSSAV